MNTTPTLPNESAEFDELLAAWRAHQDKRTQAVSIGDLMASRDELDAARLAVRSTFALAS